MNKYLEMVEKAEGILASDDVTEEQLAEAEALMAEAEKVKAVQERKDSLKAKLDKAEKVIDSGVGRKSQAVEPVEQAQIEVGKSSIERDPNAGFKNSHEFFSAVLEQGKSRSTQVQDERLQFLAIDGDGQNSNNNPDGRFLVPESMQPGILTTSLDGDYIGSMTRKIPMGSPVVKLNYRVDKDHSSSVSGGLRVYRRAQEGLITKSQMKFAQLKLEANALDGATFVTDELMNDSPESIPALIGSGFGDEFTFHLNQERLYGTGASEYQGITNSGCFISVTRSTASAIDIDDVLNMFARFWGSGGGMWLANYNTLPQIAKLQIKDNNGNSGTPAFLPSVNAGVPATLMGLPIYFSEHPKALGTPNDLMLCNWSQYLEGSIGGINQAQSMHVRFLYNEQCFKFGTRNDGRAWWNSPLTPKNGDTLSPFIGLGSA